MIDCFWSLYNTTEEVRIDGLRTIQIQALLRCLSRNSLDEWMLWQEGTNFWRPAPEVHAELEKAGGFFNVPPRPPPVGSKNDSEKAEGIRKIEFDESDTESQFALASGSPRESAAMDKRINPRFILRLRVQITVGGKLHTNETVNISMGGIKLKNPLPDNARGVLDVKIINGDHEMVVRCRTLQAKDEEQVTRLLIEAVPKPDVFRSWILAGT